MPTPVTSPGGGNFCRKITSSGRVIFSRAAVSVIISLHASNRACISISIRRDRITTFIAPQVNSLFNWLGRRSKRESRAQRFEGSNHQSDVVQDRHACIKRSSLPSVIHQLRWRMRWGRKEGFIKTDWSIWTEREELEDVQYPL